MGAALDLFFAEQGEPALDEVEPRGAGRGEVHVKSRMAHEPPSYAWRFVRAVVIEDQMQVEIRGRRRRSSRETAGTPGAMAPMTFADHLPRRDIERGKQRGCPVRR